MRLLAILCLALLPLAAELLDRIAVTVDQQVITEIQITEEVRTTAFLNRQAAEPTQSERRAAADRLIQQALVEREMKLSRYPAPGSEEVEAYFTALQSSFGGPQLFADALQTARLSSATLKQHLALQLTTLRFIEYRFRPDFQVTDAEIEKYQQSQAVPSSNQAVRETLIEQRTDEILANWLEESRKRVNIVYLDKTLQ